MLSLRFSSRNLSLLSQVADCTSLQGGTFLRTFSTFQPSRFEAGRSGIKEYDSNGADASKTAQAKPQYQFEAIAPLADGACLLTVGRTQILATVVVADSQQHVPRRQYFRAPLQVEHRERWAATGRVPSGFQKREGGTDKEKLIAAIIRHALAPMLPPTFRRAVEVTTTTLSDDGEGSTAHLAINAASMALARTRLPLLEGVAAVTLSHPAAHEMSITLAGTMSGIVMIQAQGGKISEEDLIQGCRLANDRLQEVIADQKSAVARPHDIEDSEGPASIDHAAMAQISDQGKHLVMKILEGKDEAGQQLSARLAQAKLTLEENLRKDGFFRTEAMRIPGSGCVSPLDLELGWAELISVCVAELAVHHNQRVSNRGLLNARALTSQLGTLHIPHGSALCNLDNTQTLTSITIANPSKRDNDLFTSSNLNVLVSSPSSIQTEQVDFRADRDAELMSADFIEAALKPVLPKTEVFPFAMRVNCEAFSEDGGKTDVCTSAVSLALEDAAVPLKAPVAGISVGLLSHSLLEGKGSESRTVSHGDGWEHLVDPQAIEEAACSALLRTAGTRDALTAVSLQTNSTAIPLEVVAEAICKAKPARLHILSSCHPPFGQISRSREAQFRRADVKKELLGRLIGPGGSTLRGIEEATGAKVCVTEDDRVYIYAPTEEQFDGCDEAIGELTGHALKEGHKYMVKVVKLQDFGAFVELPNGFQALLHISELEKHRVEKIHDVLEVGQELEVVCLGKDRRGYMRISRKALL